jgi:signal transduction histidine kinase
MAASVIEASRRTEALLTSLLILARSQRGLLREEDLDLAQAAAAAARLAEREAGAQSVRIEQALEPAPVQGDRALLERLAVNLVENGVRYNRPGGFVSVRTQRGRDGRAELHVENSGPRVSPAAAARLSQPFERLERGADGRGAGLGLSIVSAVSEAHGGEVVIEPREAGGLRVSVRLPTSGDRRATDSGDARLPVVPA